MEKQLRLFDVPNRQQKQMPLYYAEIIENDGSKYVIWFRKNVNNISEAKKCASIIYNKQKEFDEENIVKFGKVKEMKEAKWRTKKCWETDLQGKHKIKRRG